MSAKTTSLDILSGKGSVLDIARIFPMTPTRTLDLARHGEYIDGILEGENRYKKIDISEYPILSINRFHTLESLDMGIREVMDPTIWNRGLRDAVPRPRVLDIVPPLQIPYGALDIRRERRIVSTRTYPDIFARTLPYGLLTRRMLKGARHLYRQHYKRAIIGMLGFLVFSIPLLSYIAYALNHGYETLESLAGLRSPNSIRETIRVARGDFERANFLLTPFAWIPISQIDTISRASAGGLALTRGLDTIAQLIPNSINESGATIKKDTQDPFSYRAAARDIFPLESFAIANPTDWIAEHRSSIERARTELTIAGDIYRGVVPTGERTEKMKNIGTTISRVATILDWSLNNQQSILNMLGHTNPQRYIIFNQNRDEIRANGGFPGSLLSFTLYKGNILDYRGDDVYYYDWNLYPYKEIPPPGIALLTDNYGLRDVNYYPDFHETLAKANGFIERSGDASVTTAIAIHQGIIEDTLEILGPVSVSGVLVPFDHKNFSLLMSTLVEGKYAKENTPKDILFRFVGAFLSKLQEQGNPSELIDIVDRYIQDGEILFASRDTEVDAFLSKYRKKLPWESTAKNWIYPVWTSVSGNKSDRYIDRQYQATTKLLVDCNYENTVTLGTSHIFKKTDREELTRYFDMFGVLDIEERAKLEFIQGNGKNRAFVRVYVPFGSVLVNPGSDIATVTNKYATVFTLLMETPVGATTSKTWKYIVNIPDCQSYDGTIEWTRQPGIRKLEIK